MTATPTAAAPVKSRALKTMFNLSRVRGKHYGVFRLTSGQAGTSANRGCIRAQLWCNRTEWLPSSAMSQATPGQPRLFAVYLGGDPAPGRLSEDHEVVMVVAPDVAQARQAARGKWNGNARPHVDAVKLITVVDGFRVHLEATDEPESEEVDITYEPSGD
jgi:hypothetical protein